MKRLPIPTCVEALAASIRFYSKLFASEPTVKQPDYAKWLLGAPQVNVDVSQRGAALRFDHLGGQAKSEAERAQMHDRLRDTALSVDEQIGDACCYARSNKYWGAIRRASHRRHTRSLPTSRLSAGPVPRQRATQTPALPFAAPLLAANQSACR